MKVTDFSAGYRVARLLNERDVSESRREKVWRVFLAEASDGL